MSEKAVPPTYYDHIELTTEEVKGAIEEGKRSKYFRLKSKDYWERLESNQDQPPPTTTTNGVKTSPGAKIKLPA